MACLSFNEDLLEFFFESPRSSFLCRSCYHSGLEEAKWWIRVRNRLLKIGNNRSCVCCWSCWRLARIDRLDNWSRCRLLRDWIRRRRWFLKKLWCLLWRVLKEIDRNRCNAILILYRIKLRGLQLLLLLLRRLLDTIDIISNLLSIGLLALNCLLLLWLGLDIIIIASYWALHFLRYSCLIRYWLLLLWLGYYLRLRW